MDEVTPDYLAEPSYIGSGPAVSPPSIEGPAINGPSLANATPRMVRPAPTGPVPPPIPDSITALLNGVPASGPGADGLYHPTGIVQGVDVTSSVRDLVPVSTSSSAVSTGLGLPSWAYWVGAGVFGVGVVLAARKIIRRKR